MRLCMKIAMAKLQLRVGPLGVVRLRLKNFMLPEVQRTIIQTIGIHAICHFDSAWKLLYRRYLQHKS